VVAAEDAATSFSSSGCFETPPVMGQPVNVYGRWKKKHETATAERIEVKRIERDDVSGFAVIDAVAGPSSVVPGATEIRADGYRMLITSETRKKFVPPLQGLKDAMTNVWIGYDAKARPDGFFVLRSATFLPNTVTDGEGTMRAKNEYDPAAVPADADPQTVAVVIGLGVDPKRIPPWPDASEQKRIEEIGRKVEPAWVRKLPLTDPSRIDFRFQLTDGKKWPYVLALPSGIILVPHELVERMENDSQLAEVLAYSIACVMEKQAYRMRIANRAIAAGNLAGWVGWIPVVGLPARVAGLGAWGGQTAVIRKEQHQNLRVSLELMRDAGYEVQQAPLAWWLLGSKKPKPIEHINMPELSAYLYRVLGEMWAGRS
jgi:hypothetical protein